MSLHFIYSLLIEFGPLLLFFIGTETKGFLYGSLLLVLSVPMSLIAAYIRDRRFAIFPFMVGMLVMLLGGATVVTGNPKWIQLEYTICNGLFGIFLLSGYLFQKNWFKKLFETMLLLTDEGWRQLSLRFGLWFLITAIVNSIVSILYSPDIWIYFRILFAIAGVLFGLSQLNYTRKERLPSASPWGLRL